MQMVQHLALRESDMNYSHIRRCQLWETHCVPLPLQNETIISPLCFSCPSTCFWYPILYEILQPTPVGPRPVLGLLVTATNQDIECITRERGRAFCWGHWEVAHSSRHEEQEYNHQEWNNPSEETPLHLPGSLHYVRLLRTKHPYIPIALAQWCMEFYEESEREEFTSLGKQFKSVQENIYNTSTLHV